ncbi:hypothetical protein DMR84_27595 [Klebsiella variicola]|nr:hypothetical protein DMR84_27595 [Klebsiella variicola]
MSNSTLDGISYGFSNLPIVDLPIVIFRYDGVPDTFNNFDRTLGWITDKFCYFTILVMSQ